MILTGKLSIIPATKHYAKKGNIMRPSGRKPDQLRQIQFTRNYTKHAEGSVLVCFGDTKVICTASVEEGVPRFLREIGRAHV